MKQCISLPSRQDREMNLFQLRAFHAVATTLLLGAGQALGVS
jgi:hypothetical protein